MGRIETSTIASLRPAGLLTAAVFLVWSSALPGSFIWIDWSEIEQGGYRITSASEFLEVWTQSLEQYVERHEGTLDVHGGYFRPVYAMSISLDWWIWQRNAWLYHAENILWHLAVVLGLYAIGERLFLQCQIANAAGVAFWAALLFAVHPLGVHSTGWISGRKDLLCAAFSIISLIFWRRAIECVDGMSVAQNESATRDNGRFALNLVASVGFFLLGIFSKEQAYIVPLFVAAWVWFDWPLRKHPPRSSYRRGALVTLSTLVCVCGMAIAYRWVILQGVGLGGSFRSETWIDRAGTFSRLWWTYVGRIFCPLDPTIVDRWQLSRGIGFAEVVSIVSLIAIALFIFYAAFRRWTIAILFLWYVTWMLPALGFLPLRHIYAERYLYPCMWGLIAIGVLGVYRIFERHKLMRVAILSGILVCLSVETFTEGKHWWSDDVLFKRAITQNPSYVEGRIGLAAEALKRDDFEGVVKETRLALVSADDTRFASYWSPFIAHTNAGLALQRLGQLEVAAQHFGEALKARPNNAIAYYHLGLNASAFGDFNEAEKYYQNALLLKPNDYLTQSNLGYVFLRQNRPEESARILSRLIQANPNDVVNLANLASASLISGRFLDAELRFDALVAAEPGNPIYRAKLAWVEWKLGKKEDARSNLAAAFKLAPNDPTVRGIAAIVLKDESSFAPKR